MLLTFNALNSLASVYLNNPLSCYNSTCSLRSQNSELLVVPRIGKSAKGGWAFSYMAPKVWNSLLEKLLYITLQYITLHKLCLKIGQWKQAMLYYDMSMFWLFIQNFSILSMLNLIQNLEKLAFFVSLKKNNFNTWEVKFKAC